MSLPKNFVEEGLKLADGSTLFGVKFIDMTGEELIAAAQGWSAKENSDREFFKYRIKSIENWRRK